MRSKTRHHGKWSTRFWRQGQRRGKIDAEDAGWDLAQANHYAVRTRAYFEAKRMRGRIGQAKSDAPERYTEKYFEALNRNEDEDRSILRWRDATQAGIPELRELSKVDIETTTPGADHVR